MRGLALASVTLLAACSQGEAEPGGAKPEKVFCALGGSLQFADNCTIERTAVEGAQVIVVRHPDGAFRRLEVSKDGQNLTAADGAEQSQSALKGDRFEVILGDSRYVIPAKADASAQ